MGVFPTARQPRIRRKEIGPRENGGHPRPSLSATAASQYSISQERHSRASLKASCLRHHPPRLGPSPSRRTFPHALPLLRLDRTPAVHRRVAQVATVRATMPPRLRWSLSPPVSVIPVAIKLNQRVPAWRNWQTQSLVKSLGESPCELTPTQPHTTLRVRFATNLTVGTASSCSVGPAEPILLCVGSPLPSELVESLNNPILLRSEPRCEQPT